jgi:hypothetical protein
VQGRRKFLPQLPPVVLHCLKNKSIPNVLQLIEKLVQSPHGDEYAPEHAHEDAEGAAE